MSLPLFHGSSCYEAEEYRTADGECEEAGHAVVEEVDAASHMACLLRDDFGIVVGLVQEQVNHVVGRKRLHLCFEVFQRHIRDGAEEER